jgi:diaminohydroxyphosphoribosylaminopyrimidine deaminase/5-amino-6-(5-phosphoribosylamino)uracil reductase
MLRALELSQLGRGNVSPNPMVGCVIVYDDKIIGEGWHKIFGGPHAEVNAFDTVKDKTILKEAELYVSLEPCSHYGKTAPCAELIIRHHPRKVWICNQDPNPLVSGQGIKMIRASGIEVSDGLLEVLGRGLNRRFFTYMEKKRPYVILKWAETSDGFIARNNFESKWISSVLSRKLVHKWRGEEDAIVIGTNTARYDDPELNTRDWPGRDPVRVVLDLSLSLPEHLRLFKGPQRTIIINKHKSLRQDHLEWVMLPGKQGVPHEILEILYQKEIQSVIIEGGAQILEAFIGRGIWDEARIFRSREKVFGSGIRKPAIIGKIMSRVNITDDEITFIYNEAYKDILS